MALRAGDDERHPFRFQGPQAQDGPAGFGDALDIDHPRGRGAKGHDLDQRHHLADIDQAEFAQGRDGDAVIDIVDELEFWRIDMQDAAPGGGEIRPPDAWRAQPNVLAGHCRANPPRRRVFMQVGLAEARDGDLLQPEPAQGREVFRAQPMPLIEAEFAGLVVEFMRQDRADRLVNRDVTELHRRLRCGRR